MIVYINGREHTIEENVTLKQLFEILNYGTHVAVWVNEVQVLKQNYPIKILNEGDRIRIVKPLGGG